MSSLTFRRIRLYSIILLLLKVSESISYPQKWNYDEQKWIYLNENSQMVYCKDIYTFNREIGENRAQLFNRFRETSVKDLPNWMPEDKTCNDILRNYVAGDLVKENWVIYDVLSIHNEGNCGEHNIKLRFRVWLDYIAYGCPCLNKSELHDIDVYVNKESFQFSSYKWPTKNRPVDEIYPNEQEPCDNCSF